MPWNPQDAPPRKQVKRFNTPGHIHYLTFSCFRRQPFLSKDRTRQWLIEAIIAARRKHNFRLIAWVFMPEHAHLLIDPTKKIYSISAILQSIKIPIARKARDYILQNAPDFIPNMQTPAAKGSRTLQFWQAGGGYDRNIFTPEELREKIAYIHRNPVKRKLVQRSADWPWSSAADYAKIRQGPLPVDNQNLPWLPP